MAENERTSQELARIAARRLHDPDPEVRALAGCVLTQTPDHPRLPAQPHGDGDIVYAEDDGLSTEPTVTEQLNAAGTPPIRG